jgi:hypothetical protein
MKDNLNERKKKRILTWETFNRQVNKQKNAIKDNRNFDFDS